MYLSRRLPQLADFLLVQKELRRLFFGCHCCVDYDRDEDRVDVGSLAGLESLLECHLPAPKTHRLVLLHRLNLRLRCVVLLAC